MMEDQVVEGRDVVESQMVIQGLYNDELREKLYTEETKRCRWKADALAHTTEGHIWSGPEFLAAVEDDDRRVRGKEATKIDNKKAKEWRGKENVRVGQVHATLVGEWEEKRDKMRARCGAGLGYIVLNVSGSSTMS